MRVGVVGTGEMGRPVIDRLVAAGHEVSAYSRRAEVRAALDTAGVHTVDQVTQLGPRCEVVLVYVYTDEQVRSVALDDGLLTSMSPGSVLVVHTTGSPATVRELAGAGAPLGVGVLDAAGSGGPADVAAGRLNLFVGGDAAHLDTARPVFDAYASTVTHFGAVGSGQVVKLLNNLLFGCHIEVALEASRLAAAFGIDDVALARTLHTCSGQSYSLDLVGAMGGAAAMLAAAGRFVHKDVEVACALAHEAGVGLGTLDAITVPLLARTKGC